MAKAANVRSLEALREFRVALIQFIDKAKRAISTSDSEVMRTKIWLQSNQPSHWISEIRKSEEKLNQAKSELFRATLSQPDNPRGPTDQIRLVRRRKEEIQHAKEKLEKTKHWSRKFERSTNEYRGAMSPLSSALDGTANKAVILIEKSIASLESYIASSVPTTEETLESTLNNSNTDNSIARKGDKQMEPNTDEHANSDSTIDEGNEDNDVSMGRSD